MKRSHLSLPLALAMLFAVLVAAPAQSADRPIFYFGAAGGSQIRALGTTISSDLTGSSAVSGFVRPREDTNVVAGPTVRGVLKIGAIETFARSSAAGAGTRIVTGGKTADVNVLNGLITAKAVETRATAVYQPDGTTRSSAITEFVNLKILGETVPVNVKKNTTISIPGIALVVLNGQQTSKVNGGIVTQGFGAYIRLLNNRGRLAIGAEILLNPTLSAVAPGTPNDVPQVGGIGYGTNVRANVLDGLATVDVGPTAMLVTPMVGTNGKVLRNTTASTDVEGLINTGTVISKSFATTGKRRSFTTMSNQTQSLNLLNGLVTADAIKVTSTAERRAPSDKIKKTMAMTFVNLQLLGAEVPIDVSPNTKITVLGGLLDNEPIAEVTINKRIRNKYGSAIIGLEVKLLKDRGVLKTGAIVELAVATTWIYV